MARRRHRRGRRADGSDVIDTARRCNGGRYLRDPLMDGVMRRRLRWRRMSRRYGSRGCGSRHRRIGIRGHMLMLLLLMMLLLLLPRCRGGSNDGGVGGNRGGGDGSLKSVRLGMMQSGRDRMRKSRRRRRKRR
jgi:hypothetical protein